MALAIGDPQEAFRIGLQGRPFAESRYPGRSAGAGLSPDEDEVGPNEEVVLGTQRLPGLTEARAAFETGRVLRAVAKLLDQARAPAAVGRQFRDNLSAAAIAHVTRRAERAWGSEDTIAMFLEMYVRILGSQDHAILLVRDALTTYAKDELAPLPGSKPRPIAPPVRRQLFVARR